MLAPAAELQPLLQALPEPLLLLAPDASLLAANAAAARTLLACTGLEPGQAIAQNRQQLLALTAQALRHDGRVPGRLQWQQAGEQRSLRCDLVALRADTAAGAQQLLLRLLQREQGMDRFHALNERIAALSAEVLRRRAAEELLAEQREWLQVTLRSIGDAVIATDPGERIVFMNPVAEALSGWSSEEAQGQPLDEVFRIAREDDMQPVPSPVAEALRRRRIVGLAQDTVLLARDHRVLPIDDAAAPIVDAQGRLRGAVLVFREISERLAAERRRRDLEQQLRNAQKLEALGTLAGGIAHDFNNVVAAVLGSAQLAREELAAGVLQAQRLEQIDRAGRRARELVRKILAFGRRQTHELKRQALQPLVEETVALLRSTLPGTVEIALELPQPTLHVLADGTQLQQVLMNLCTNAWHALKGSTGRIAVVLESFEGNAPAGLVPGFGPWVAGRYARISVIDSGQGMDQATQRRIFEPFFTTKPRGQGSGLGLAVVHGILAEHRGAIALHSAPGAGARFEVFLPLTVSEGQPLEATGLPLVPAPQGHGEQVLYVDDDEVLGLTVQALLQRAGYRVTYQTCPLQALQMLQQPGWAVLVSDYNMPRLNGLDLARQARGLWPQLPIIIASGYVSQDLRDGASPLGRVSLVHKEELFEILPPLLARLLPAAQ